MRRLCGSILFGLCLAGPQAVSAATGVVRGGEHPGFTRLTVSTDQILSDVQAQTTGQGRYQLAFTPGLSTVDSSRVFDRLNANRVTAVIPKDNGLEIVLNCNCEAIATLGSPGLVIIDISERPDFQAAELPLLPNVTAVLPNQTWRPVDDSGLFALDFSVLDRLNKTISAQIGQTAHISGFSELAVLAHRNAPVVDREQTEAISSAPQHDRCAWSDAIWATFGGPPNAAHDEAPDDTVLVDQDAIALQDALVVQFLSEGRLEEARIAFLAWDPVEEERQNWTQFEAMFDATADPGALRLGDCNPFDDLLIAAMKHEADVPNSVKIDLLNAFSVLPVGLQLRLYQRLTWLVGESGDTLFPGLSQHFAAELAMAERVPVDQDKSGPEIDPDRLAAISIELRGTDHEKQSWQASFASYLAHQRYFDALHDLADDPPLTAPERSLAVSELVDHLVTHADSITFVQIALAVLPDLDPAPSEAALNRVADRLALEGFTSVAQTATEAFPDAVLDSAPKPDDAGELLPSVERDTSPSIGGDTPVASPEGVTENLTVALARQRAEAAQALRQSLVETLSR